MGQVIHQSVSGILRYKNQSYIVQRDFSQRYFPGYWCFPGGKISKHDGNDEDRYKRALIRELQEELSINIQNDKITFLDKTLTPSFAPYRFENYFFVVELDQKLEIQLDGEHRKGMWINDNEVIDFFAKPTTLTIPPIPFYLKSLLNQHDSEYKSQYIDNNEQILKADYIGDISFYMVPSLALPPSKHTNTLLIGKDEKLLVDPSPRHDEHIDILINEFSNQNIQSIFISHWHPDHHQNLKSFATRLNLAVLMSQESVDQIEARWGKDYLNEISLQIVKEGDIIQLGSLSLKVKSHEGHAKGQIGLENLEQDWVFVSDVFQGLGSVVVEDMDAYIHSLESLLSYDHETIYIPSHGVPIMGHHQLKQLLNHRLEREQQVKELRAKGYSPEEILKAIYPDLPESMSRYALKNIHGHIERLQKD